MNISENLKRLRVAKKISQKEMGQMLGFKSHNAYSHWETGRNSPNVRDLEKLSEILGAPVQNILFGGNPPVSDVAEKNTRVEELEKEISHLKRKNMLLQVLAKQMGAEFPKFKGATIMPDFNLFRKKNPRFILWNQGISKRKGL